jgi:hypothetical protein
VVVVVVSMTPTRPDRPVFMETNMPDSPVAKPTRKSIGFVPLSDGRRATVYEPDLDTWVRISGVVFDGPAAQPRAVIEEVIACCTNVAPPTKPREFLGLALAVINAWPREDRYVKRYLGKVKECLVELAKKREEDEKLINHMIDPPPALEAAIQDQIEKRPVAPPKGLLDNLSTMRRGMGASTQVPPTPISTQPTEAAVITEKTGIPTEPEAAANAPITETIAHLKGTTRQPEILRYLWERPSRHAELSEIATDVYRYQQATLNVRRQCERIRENLEARGCPLRLRIVANAVFLDVV